MQGHYRTETEARPRHVGCCEIVTPARLFLCADCRDQVLICSGCDRGNIYCADCAVRARQRSMRAAGKRYQATYRGRMKHADRERRYRARKNNVTHQGSPPGRLDDLLAENPAAVVVEPSCSDVPRRQRGYCQGCGRRCPELVRRDFLRHRRGPPAVAGAGLNNRRGLRRDHSP